MAERQPSAGTAASEAPYETMGATFLAAQPVSEIQKTKAKIDAARWTVANERLESTLASLRMWRYSWWGHWARLAEFFRPRRYHWLVVANRMNRGSAINDSIVDGTGLLAVNVCSSGMWAGFTNPARPWIKIAPQDPNAKFDQDGKAWIDQAEETLYTVLGRSNFYTIMAQAFEDVVVFGTAPVIIYEDAEDVIRCYLPCAGEYYLGVGSRLAVDQHYREFTFNVRQIVEMFGIENCPGEVVKLWQAGGGSVNNEFVVCHAIEPNTEISSRDGSPPFRLVPKNFTYREVYWLKGHHTDRPLSLRGFNSKPFMTLKWSSVSNDAYGRSPCMDALGDNKQVQMETMRKGEFIEKLVRPPMGADPVLRNEPASIIPGRVTYVNADAGKKGFWPLFEVNPAGLPAITSDIAGVAQRIDKALFVDVFMAITQMAGVQPRNELELTKRDLERLQRLGPVIDLVEGEIKQGIVRILDIVQRRKLLPPLPDSLKQTPLKLTFDNIMRAALQSAKSVAMKDVLQTMGALSSAAKAGGVPDPLRVIDLDASARIYAETNNYPAEAIFTEDEVQEHDKQRAEAQQQAQAPALAMAGVNAAKTLSDTQVPGGSALGAIMGAAGAPQTG